MTGGRTHRLILMRNAALIIKLWSQLQVVSHDRFHCDNLYFFVTLANKTGENYGSLIWRIHLAIY